MNDIQLKEASKHLQQAFLTLQSPTELFNFLRDLLTEQELIEFSQRFDIAHRLSIKESYKHIEKETGASSTTIARVAKFLQGGNKGYQTVFDRIAW